MNIYWRTVWQRNQLCSWTKRFRRMPSPHKEPSFSCRLQEPCSFFPTLSWIFSVHDIIIYQCYFHTWTWRSLAISWMSSQLNDFVVQSPSPVQLFEIPWTAVHQASLSFTISQSLLKLMSIEYHWYHSTISSTVIPFSSCPQAFPASGSFLICQLFTSGGQSIRASA